MCDCEARGTFPTPCLIAMRGGSVPADPPMECWPLERECPCVPVVRARGATGALLCLAEEQMTSPGPVMVIAGE
jgi:hypothetical protein